jgi:hypothetical protein
MMLILGGACALLVEVAEVNCVSGKLGENARSPA